MDILASLVSPVIIVCSDVSTTSALVSVPTESVMVTQGWRGWVRAFSCLLSLIPPQTLSHGPGSFRPLCILHIFCALFLLSRISFPIPWLFDILQSYLLSTSFIWERIILAKSVLFYMLLLLLLPSFNFYTHGSCPLIVSEFIVAIDLVSFIFASLAFSSVPSAK